MVDNWVRKQLLRVVHLINKQTGILRTHTETIRLLDERIVRLERDRYVRDVEI
jgi:hypothetical protein